MNRKGKPQRNMTNSLNHVNKSLFNLSTTPASKEKIRQLKQQAITTPRGQIIGQSHSIQSGNDSDFGQIGNTRHPSQSMHAISTKPAEMKVKQLSERELKMAKALAPTKGHIRSATKRQESTTVVKRDHAVKMGAKLPSMLPPYNNDTSPVDFPIDMVYTWVDGSDEEWQNTRQKFLPTQKNIPKDSLSTCRWRDFDELRFSIESVERFAPWIRTIFIISDFQRPYWFDENNPGKIKFIDHPDLFGEFEEHLPTFNSHAIESHLHRIPDLAEHFIYSNDDTFLGNDVYPLDFFTKDGKFKVFLSTTDLETEQSIQKYTNNTPKPPVLNAVNSKLNPKINHTKSAPVLDRIDIVPYFTSQAVTNNILDQTFGPSPASRKRLKHQMKAFRKSTFDWCWENEQMQLYLFNTSLTRFRSLGDVDPTTLISYAGILLEDAVPSSITSTYYGITDETDISKVFRHLSTTNPMSKLYCINDSLEHPPEEKLNAIRNGMELYLPHKNN